MHVFACLVGCLLLSAAAVAAPAGSEQANLVLSVLEKLGADIQNSTKDGKSVSKTDSAKRTEISAPGPSSTQAVLTSAAGTPEGEETSSSTVLATGKGDAGPDGLSGSLSVVGGGSNTDGSGAGSDGTALVGSVAVKNGKISVTTAIIKTDGHSDKGTNTGTLGMTTSVAPDGDAKGIHESGSTSGPAKESTSQGDLQLGSSVGDVSSEVTVSGGSQTTKKDSPPKPKKRESAIDRATRRLGLD
ncbi:protein qua-1-like [Pollicipes pollicipes]|uniref:protein qua-1-like n=1 Tax=Pollicipes pollicipes TaxID=41117 RepID=UPI001884B097|nr:protein qua-1-like [Pollicipes pollicipes]